MQSRLSGDATRRCRRSPDHTLARLLLQLLSVLLLLPIAAAHAQHVGFSQYGPQRGLSNLGLLCLDQAPDGAMLLCTEDGVFRYDGRRFDPYGIDRGLPPGGVVRDLRRAPDGTVFVVYNDAVWVAEPERFAPASSTVGAIDVAAPHRTALLGNDLLLVERGHLRIVRRREGAPASITAYFDPATLAAHPELDSVVSVMTTADGIWLGCGKAALCHVGTGTAPPVSVAEPAQDAPAQDWTALLQDRGGVVWARSLDHIARRPVGAADFDVKPIPGGAGRYSGHTDRLVLVETPDGRILTQGRDGLLSWSRGAWSMIDVRQGVPEGEIVSILFDRENVLWLGIRSQGAFRGIGLGQWEYFTRDDGLADNVVWQMARTGGGPLWVASEAGVDALPQTVRPPVQPAQHLPGSSFAVATTSTGRVWRATLDGTVGRLDPVTGRQDGVSRLPPADLMLVDRLGRLWIGTHDGLYRIDRPEAARPAAPVRVDGVAGRIHDLIEAPDGGLWLIAEQSLVRLDRDGVPQPIAGSVFVPMPRTLALGPDGTLWIGSGTSGIERLHVDGNRLALLDRIAMPAIGSNTTLFIKRDRRGWMWVGNDRGLDVWNGRSWDHLDEEDGLLSDDLDEGSVLDDPDGTMWFGTGHGLAHLIDTGALFTTPPLHPVITARLLGNHPLPDTPIHWSQQPLVIKVSALDFGDQPSIRFRYRLSGVDGDWVETTASEIRYPTLPPGRLTFSLVAIDPLKHRISQPVSFVVTVLPPWWRNWTFLVACALLLPATIVSLWRLRVRVLLQRQRQLEALVAERTSEIEAARAALFEQATRDSLTGLLNRPAIMQAFDLALADSRRTRQPLAIGLLDIDHFKSINDRFGHLGGDDVLRMLGSRLIQGLRPGEQAGRYGGEELVLLIPGETPTGTRFRQLHDLLTGQPIHVEDSSIDVTCSIGVAWWRDDDTAQSLMRRADQFLYEAKNTGRDRLVAEPAD